MFEDGREVRGEAMFPFAIERERRFARSANRVTGVLLVGQDRGVCPPAPLAARADRDRGRALLGVLGRDQGVLHELSDRAFAFVGGDLDF